MRTAFRITVRLIGILLLAACGRAGISSIPSLAPTATSPMMLHARAFTRGHATAAQLGLWPRPGPAVPLCGPVGPGFVRCDAWIRTDVHGIGPDGVPLGYAPADLQTAYRLTPFSASNGNGQTVAIVDAYDDPNLESDLGVYRKQWGLPDCTTADGCFKKVALTKKTSASWGGEESLDVDMVSAICPHCRILVVEANGTNQDYLTTAERYATAHASYVSNSWSSPEGYTKDDSHYNVPGVMIAAATADNGYAQGSGKSVAQWPAILPTVIAVGGTDLTSIAPRTENAWSGAGSGCSTIYGQPSFQRGLSTGCKKRAQADVSASAGTCCGVAVYDSYHSKGWVILAGTSEATPIITAVYALGGCSGKCTKDNNAYLYAHASSLYDVTSGSNGSCGAPLCTAGPGWDGPTGLGAPNGLGPFGPPPPPVKTKLGSGFSYPSGVAVAANCSANCNVYVADTNNSAVKEIASNGKIVVIGSGFDQPYGVAVDAGNNVYVADTRNSVIKVVAPNGTIAQIGSGFFDPFGVAVDVHGAGNVYVADTDNNAVEMVASNVVTPIGSGFFEPVGVAVDANGNVYVADTGNNAVKMVAPNGTITTIGSGFSKPSSVAVDASWNVYVADTYNNTIWKITP